MSRPDFGMHRTTTQDGVELECRYAVPGLTLHDLVMIYDKASKSPGNNHFSGNPSQWPEVAGVIAVKEAILDAIYPPQSRALNDSTE